MFNENRYLLRLVERVPFLYPNCQIKPIMGANKFHGYTIFNSKDVTIK